MSKIIVENNTFNSPVVMGDKNSFDYKILSNDIESLKKQVAIHTGEIKYILSQIEKAVEDKDDYKLKDILKQSYDKLENFFVGFSSSYLANIITMKLIVLFIFSGFALLSFGQEDPAVTTKLGKKYESVSYTECLDTNYESYYLVKDKTGKYGLCNLTGKEIIPCKYDFIMNLCDCYQCSVGEKRGACNFEGKEIVPPEYNLVSMYKICDADFYMTELDDKSGLYNSNGEEILPCVFDFINQYGADGMAICVRYKGKYGVYSLLNGKNIIPCIYSYIEIHRCEDRNIFIVVKDGTEEKPLSGKWGLLADNNKEILPCEYGYIGQPYENLMLCNKGGRCIDGANCKGGKYGYLDINGNVVIECIYDIATHFEDGIAQVEKDGVASLVSHPYKGTALAIANGTTHSEIDVDIPQVNKQNTETFAFIVANENYNNFSGSDYSINDGKIFAEYCKKTLGIPEHNVRYSEDATYGNLVSTIKKIEDIASVYEGEATIILFYSGLGTIDEQTRERYILPTDASISSIKNTGFQVQKLMEQLNALKTKGVLVLLDAPFTGANKKGESFIKKRGIRISPKEVIPCGQTFICFSHDSNENSYMSTKYGHGLFTYCLLKKLKESKGNCTWKELLEETSFLVKKESLQQYDNVQTPIYVLPESNQLISNKTF